jgi:UDP-N-acetylmuramoyl-L-alanyl-D-glutamate--2,6-diaminopimelate ligase
MKCLKDILPSHISCKIQGDDTVVVHHIAQEVEKLGPHGLFFAIKGIRFDGHTRIEDAIAKGAVAVICSELPPHINPSITYVQVPDSRQAMGFVASAFYGHPSQKLTLVGVTGTNGKSTVATMLYQFFSSLGHTCGLISTISYTIGNLEYTSTHTTPDPIRLNALLAEMCNKGCTYAFMEVSSIAVDQGRINGLHFKGAIFTNLSHDHLDYHGTYANYLAAKKKWFDTLSEEAFALTNTDDKHGKIMVQNTKASVYTYAVKRMADFKAQITETDFAGMQLKINGHELWVHVVGSFNAQNILSVYGAAFLLGVSQEDILPVLSAVKGAKGRFQTLYGPQKRIGIVDYAHSPDALLNILETIQSIRTGNEKLILVFGCGGDRDKEKRPLMGEIAVRFAQQVILTSDNPRSEDPQEIINDIKKGIDSVQLKKVLTITDRLEAIRTAVALSNPHDILVVAGKGHENYQETNGVKTPFDDAAILNQLFTQYS